MSNDDKCPCVDGLPDPCTLCGAPADGVCEIDTLVGWKHRAQRAEAEARQLREQDAALVEANRSLGADLERLREAIKTIAWTIDPEDGMTDPALIVVHMEAGALEDLRAAIAAAVAEGAEDRGQTDG